MDAKAVFHASLDRSGVRAIRNAIRTAGEASAALADAREEIVTACTRAAAMLEASESDSH